MPDMNARVAVALFALCAATLVGCAQNPAQPSPPAATEPVPAAAASGGPVMGDVSRGGSVFRANCSACHTTDGSSGGVGPSLQHEKTRKNYEQTVAWIDSPDPPMPKLYPAVLSEKDEQ